MLGESMSGEIRINVGPDGETGRGQCLSKSDMNNGGIQGLTKPHSTKSVDR